MGELRLPNPFRRPETRRRGSHVARGLVSYRGDGLGDRLQALGVRVHDPMRDAYEAGRFGTARSGGGLSHPALAEGGDIRGSTVRKAPDIAPLVQGDAGFTWDGLEE